MAWNKHYIGNERANVVDIIHRALFLVRHARMIPAAMFYFQAASRHDIDADIARWNAIAFADVSYQTSNFFSLLRLLRTFREFRNLYYYRASQARVFSVLCPQDPTLYLRTAKIGGGLFIQHGFATIVDAKSIGKNCWINQQVTVGHNGPGGAHPVIEDDVRIGAGAKVIGNIRVGEGSKIGANAVVVKDVPPHCTVVGIPAKIVSQNAARVKEIS